MGQMEREYDFVIYGASGFTAKYVIDYFIKNYNYKILASGRSKKKVEENLREILQNGNIDIPIMEADHTNIDDLTSKSKILLNCAGPFIKCGEFVVQSCVENETHYLDITGEPAFIKNMIEKYDEIAKKRNIYIINCCGFDSIPADLGVEYLRKNMEGIEKDITSVLTLNNLKVNYSTYSSLVYSMSNPPKKTEIVDTQDRKKFSKKIKKMIYSKLTKSFWVIFLGSDAFIVRRTQRKVSEKGDFAKYAAYLETGNFFTTILILLGFSLLAMMSKFSITRNLLLAHPKFFSFGFVEHNPSLEQIKKGNFSFLFKGNSKLDNKIVSKKLIVKGRDPGYITTPICLVESAVLFKELLNKEEEISEFGGGVVTPGIVFGNDSVNDLVERLTKKGVEFKILED